MPAATAEATVIQAITIKKGDDLRFGSFIPFDDVGTVKIPANPFLPRNASLGITLFGEELDVGPASFAMTGEAELSYNITLPNDGSFFIKYGDYKMGVNVFSSVAFGPQTFDVNGDAGMYVGATLSVAANQEPGSYTGSFDVKVTYQ